VRTVVTSCAQIMHAIRILRSRGVGDAQFQLVYRAVVVAKLTYDTIRYDTIEEINVDSKAEYTA